MGASGTHTRRSCRLFQEVRCHEALHHARGREDCRRRWRCGRRRRGGLRPRTRQAPSRARYLQAVLQRGHAPLQDSRHRTRASCPRISSIWTTRKPGCSAATMANRKPSPIFQVGEDGARAAPRGAPARAAPFTAATAPPSPPPAPYVFLTVRDGFVAHRPRRPSPTAADGDILAGHRAPRRSPLCPRS